MLGGSKPEDNVKLLQKTRNKVLASGLFGPFCLMALGKNLGKQNKIMQDSLKKYAPIIKQNKNKIILPTDLAIEQKGKRQDLKIDEFPLNEEIFDLGIETIERYAQEIIKAKAVFFKGLAGLCNTPCFFSRNRSTLARPHIMQGIYSRQRRSYKCNDRKT